VTRIRIVLILTENWTMRPAPDVAELVTFAVEAERAGLDAVMVSEHVVLGPSADAAGLPANPRDYALPGNQDPATPWPSPLVLLSAIAAVTTRIRLVAGALISPLRHPLSTAKDLATLDRLSGGRLVVQPMVSWHRDEYDALGVPFGQRGEILDEQLEIWAEAWNGSPVSHSGKHYSFGPIWVEPQPARPGGPDLWFGGSSLHPRLIARLVRYGSGFNPLGPAGDLAPVADLDQALSAVPAQLAGGFTTICVKPSQFIDDTAAIGAFCRSLAAKAASLGES
jgi:probable F420-dependent oxidoreductase